MRNVIGSKDHDADQLVLESIFHAAEGTRLGDVAPIDEGSQILVAAAPERDRALWATAFFAGLRRGELAGLRWEDDDLDADLLHVRRGWDMQEGPIAAESRAGLRSVPLCKTLRAHLVEHRLRSGRSEGLVFGRSSTRPFEPGGVQARADTAWKRHQLERVTLHECRHAYSTFVDAAEVWPTRADGYMGHSDHSTPGRYRHQLEQQYAEDAARLDQYFTGAQAGAQAAQPASLRGI